MCSGNYPTDIGKSSAILTLIVNIFIPGVGTMIAALISDDVNCGCFLVGLLQFILFPILIGWVWAILWSCTLIKKTKEEKISTVQHQKPPPQQQHSQQQPPQSQPAPYAPQPTPYAPPPPPQPIYSPHPQPSAFPTAPPPVPSPPPTKPPYY